MADVNVEQVVMTLTKKFKAGQRFIFWYDDNSEFKDSVNELKTSLSGVATVVELRRGHQLEIKLRLLDADEKEQFLIYSPQPQLILEEDHLRDMFLYSESFKADAQEIMRKELHLPSDMYHFVKDHTTFFGSKERRSRFIKLDLSSYHAQPSMAIMATIVRLDQPLVDFFSILRLVLKKGLTDNEYLDEFQKYDVLSDFWQIIGQQFDFKNKQLDLLSLVSSLYVTMAFQQMELDQPKETGYDLSHKSANVQTFMQQFSAEAYREEQDYYDIIAKQIWNTIPGKIFSHVNINDMVKSDVFIEFDRKILSWLQDQLLLENDEITINGLSIGQLTKKRRELHYGRTGYIKHLYNMMSSAWQLIQRRDMKPADDFNEMISEYTEDGYYMDTDYRHFINEYHQANYPEFYGELKRLIEQIYVDYLSRFSISWNRSFNYSDVDPRLLQRNFYKQYVGAEQNRIVVIISDSFRFEVAKELESRLKRENQVTDLNMKPMISGLPSVTYMGMAALLPHRQLDLQPTMRRVEVNGEVTNNIEKRQEILQTANPKSIAYRYKELQGKTRDQLRAMFANQEVIYIYHNQIDTTAENQGTEDETFMAADKAILELQDLIWRLRTNSINHVYVTADHGYLYRENKISAIDKVEVTTTDEDWKSPRYLVSKRDIDIPGVDRQRLADVLDNNDDRYVYYPSTANVFKANGSDNYVHGGSSLEEMIVPLLEIRTTGKKSSAHTVELQISNTNLRIMSPEVLINVIQTEPISAKVLPAVFRLYFTDENDRQISGQVPVNANITKTAVQDRMRTVKITLIDQPYDRTQAYYLVIENIETGEQQRVQYSMDIVKSNDD